MLTKTYEEVVSYLKEKQADYDEISQPLFNQDNIADWVYDIEVVGDWKHSHGYLRWCMEQIGYVQTNEIITEDDGSDWYGSIHRFVVKEAADIFKD